MNNKLENIDRKTNYVYADKQDATVICGSRTIFVSCVLFLFYVATAHIVVSLIVMFCCSVTSFRL
jgi:hypothetical protein